MFHVMAHALQPVALDSDQTIADLVPLEGNHSKVRYIIGRPARPVGDPLHYDAFVQAICAQYTERFGVK